MKKYKVTLTEEEHKELMNITQKGKHKAQKIRNANILLNCDEGEFSDKVKNLTISKVLNISSRTIDRVKRHFVEDGIEIALNGKPYENTKPPKIDGDLEAKMVVLACSKTPEGYARWTLRLLADRMVKLQYIDKLSHETVRQVLKKTNLNLGKRNAL